MSLSTLVDISALFPYKNLNYFNLLWLHVIFFILNQCVGEDIEDLEYTPKPEFEGYFKVTNVSNEVN